MRHSVTTVTRYSVNEPSPVKSVRASERSCSPSYKTSNITDKTVLTSLDVPFTLERFTLVCAELDRLRTQNAMLSAENESLKIHADAKYNLVVENERLRNEILGLKAHHVEVSSLNTRIELLSNENYRLLNQCSENKTLQGELSLLNLKVQNLNEEREKLCVILSHKEEELLNLRHKVVTLGDVEQKVALLLTEKERLVNERERLTEIISTQIREVECLKVRACEADVLAHKVSGLDSDKLRLSEIIVEQSKENEGLKSRAVLVASLEGKIEHADKERNALHHILSDKETALLQLKKQVLDYEEQFLSLGELNGKVALLVSENDRLHASLEERERQITSLTIRVSETAGFESQYKVAAGERETLTRILIEKDQEIMTLRNRIAEIGDIEHRLTLLLAEKERLMGERDNLTIIITEKLREIEGLKKTTAELYLLQSRFDVSEKDNHNLRCIVEERSKEISSLKDKTTHLEIRSHEASELEKRVALLILEKERLNQLLLEKMELVEEWTSKYLTLESLYQSVKEATVQLDVVKQKYENAVLKSESTQKARNSVHTMMTKKYVSNHSELSGEKTDDSLNASPKYEKTMRSSYASKSIY